MNWLLDNPISEMQGPLFLGLYAGLIALVFAEVLYKSRRADRSRDLGPMPVPTKPDPFEIAYLRGGHHEVTRLLVFDLIRRGYLRIVEEFKLVGKGTETRIEQVPDHPDLDPLSPMEAVAFAYFEFSKKPQTLFQPTGLSSKLKVGLEPLAGSLREEQLLPGPDRYAAAGRIWWGGALMILMFGGFKLAVALAKGRYNVGFLIAFALLALVFLGFACIVPRVTRRGKDYLARLRDAFEGLKPRMNDESAVSGCDPALILVPAVFGVAALTGTPYGYYPTLFRSAASSGSCGGGCGAATSSCGGGGGGDGGGGGGCGGGGCGGGCGGCGS